MHAHTHILHFTIHNSARIFKAHVVQNACDSQQNLNWNACLIHYRGLRRFVESIYNTLNFGNLFDSSLTEHCVFNYFDVICNAVFSVHF